MKLLDILVRDLKQWPAKWGEYCVWAYAEGRDIGAWFHTRRPQRVDGGWNDIGTVEHWLTEVPEDNPVITLQDWVDAIREMREHNIKHGWNGEGVPPIGTICECDDCDFAGWFKCEVFAYRNGYPVAEVLSRDLPKQFTGGDEHTRFRPYLTPEQFAAKRALAQKEKRDKAIAQIMKEIPMHVMTSTELVAWFYDAGYRKPVAP